MSHRPNILFIISDQHNARMLGAAGDPTARTPNIDRIARRGVRFQRAYCSNPICSPSRISIYTGQEVVTHGYYGNCNWGLGDACPAFLPTLVRESGYQTALVGRSHMVYRWDHEGFGHVAYMNLGDCDRYRLEDNPWLMHLIENDAADHYDISLPCSASPNGGFTSSMPVAHCEEGWIADEAIRFLRGRDRGRPFYLHVGYDHPHDPIAPPADFDRLFTPDMVELPGNAWDTFDGKPGFLRAVRHRPGGYPHTPRDEEHLKWLVAKQYALVALVDHSIGRILDELVAQEELDNTLVVYTADHGDFAGEHGMVLKNLGIYESIHRSPLVISWPSRLDQGRSTNAIVELIDLYPTLLKAAGVRPADSDGQDLMGVLAGTNQGRDYALCDWERARAIRSDRFRLVEYLDQDTGELYDLDVDPGEIHNVWDDPACAREKEDLLAALHEAIPMHHAVRTSWVNERASERAQAWFPDDSPIFAMWQYGIKWSQLQPYIQDRARGGKRLTVPASELSKRYPFALPEYRPG